MALRDPKKSSFFHTFLEKEMEQSSGPNLTWMLLTGQAFPTKSSCAFVQWKEPMEQGGIQTLNGIYLGLGNGLVADEGPDMGLLPFLFFLLMEMMELMS